MRANEASVKELKASVGLLKGKELIDKKLTFWTITICENEESMKGFRGYFHTEMLCNIFPNGAMKHLIIIGFRKTIKFQPETPYLKNYIHKGN